MKAQKGFVPIQPGQASRDHSERQTAGHRNETDLLPPRAQGDGSRACLTPASQKQPVAAGVARSFLQENWLDLSSKKLEIKGVGCVGTRCCLRGRSRLGAVADPI